MPRVCLTVVKKINYFLSEGRLSRIWYRKHNALKNKLFSTIKFFSSSPSVLGQDSDAGRDWGQEKGTTEDEMAGWHHRLDGREFE